MTQNIDVSGGEGGRPESTPASQQEHLRVLVNQLRRKLEREPTNPRYVVTEPWVGYRFGVVSDN